MATDPTCTWCGGTGFLADIDTGAATDQPCLCGRVVVDADGYDALRARLAAIEAERDVARHEVDRLEGCARRHVHTVEMLHGRAQAAAERLRRARVERDLAREQLADLADERNAYRATAAAMHERAQWAEACAERALRAGLEACEAAREDYRTLAVDYLTLDGQAGDLLAAARAYRAAEREVAARGPTAPGKLGRLHDDLDAARAALDALL